MKTLKQLITIPKILDDCNLFFAEHPTHIPFKIKRVYFITNSLPKLARGLHAHYKNKQVIFCIQGKIKLILDDGKRQERIILDSPEVGVFIDKMIWHEMHNFQKKTILLVLSSLKFNEKDYIRDYNQFKKQLPLKTNDSI